MEKNKYRKELNRVYRGLDKIARTLPKSGEVSYSRDDSKDYSYMSALETKLYDQSRNIALIFRRIPEQDRQNFIDYINLLRPLIILAKAQVVYCSRSRSEKERR